MPDTCHPPERTYDHIPVVELDRAPLRPVISPIPTVFMLTRDALQDGRLGTPRVWREAALSALRASDIDALAPLTDSETKGWPSLLDEVADTHESLDQGLDRIASTPGDALVESLESDHDVSVTAAWDPLRRRPERWLTSYVEALHRSWQGLQPLWQRSVALLEREVDRIDAALDRGTSHAQVLTELNPRASLTDGDWRTSAHPEPRRLRARPEGTTVVPMIIGSRACIMSSPDDRIAHLAYPLPDVWRAFDGQAPPPASLEALLGARRATILYRLDQPQTAGQIADLLLMAPSAITFHLHGLEAAGLVYRERRGRNIIVHRTNRGTTLLALYELP